MRLVETQTRVELMKVYLQMMDEQVQVNHSVGKHTKHHQNGGYVAQA